jgi:hypothetical protein
MISSVFIGRANRGLVRRPLSDGGGGCIACDRNEEEECYLLAAIKQTNGAKRPAKDVMVW